MSIDHSEARGRVLRVVGDMAPFRDAPVEPHSLLREGLGYDSLSLLELAAALEDEFELPPDAELDADVETVADVADTVIANLDGSPAG